jgi:hypothetical protein
MNQIYFVGASMRAVQERPSNFIQGQVPARYRVREYPINRIRYSDIFCDLEFLAGLGMLCTFACSCIYAFSRQPSYINSAMVFGGLGIITTAYFELAALDSALKAKDRLDRKFLILSELCSERLPNFRIDAYNELRSFEDAYLEAFYIGAFIVRMAVLLAYIIVTAVAEICPETGLKDPANPVLFVVGLPAADLVSDFILYRNFARSYQAIIKKEDKRYRQLSSSFISLQAADEVRAGAVNRDMGYYERADILEQQVNDRLRGYEPRGCLTRFSSAFRSGLQVGVNVQAELVHNLS